MIGAQKGRHANMGLLKVTGERRLGNMWKLKVCIAQIHPTGYRILALGNRVYSQLSYKAYTVKRHTLRYGILFHDYTLRSQGN
jgi:hypothetical protein